MSDINIGAPLDLDLNTVDTSMPLLAEGIYDLRIDKAEIKPTADGKASLINLELASTSPATGYKGEQLQPGVKVFDRIMLAPTGKATWDMVLRNLAGLVQAAQVMGANAGNAAQWVPTLNGRIVRAKVGYEPAGEKNGKSFREKNTIRMYIKQ